MVLRRGRIGVDGPEVGAGEEAENVCSNEESNFLDGVRVRAACGWGGGVLVGAGEKGVAAGLSRLPVGEGGLSWRVFARMLALMELRRALAVRTISGWADGFCLRVGRGSSGGVGGGPCDLRLGREGRREGCSRPSPVGPSPMASEEKAGPMVGGRGGLEAMEEEMVRSNRRRMHSMRECALRWRVRMIGGLIVGGGAGGRKHLVNSMRCE